MGFSSKSILIRIAIVGWAVSFSPGSGAAEATALCPKILKPAFENFDARTLLQRHGLDPDRIRFEANMNMTYDPKWPERFNWGVRVFYADEEAGFMGLGATNLYDPPQMHIGVTELRGRKTGEPGMNYRGKGLGAILYLIVGKIAHEKWGLAFAKSDQVSMDALSMWKRLSGLGYVTRRTYRFKPEAVSNGSLSDLQNYFDAHLRSRPEWSRFYDGFVDELAKTDPVRAKPYQ